MMTIEDDEGFEGVEFHTPIGSFRAGKGGGWQEEADQDLRRAKRRVRRVMGFYRHLSTFVSVLLVLLAIDIVTGADEFWVHWVALIWGIILALHFLNVWVFDAVLGGEAERRMVEQELRKRQGRGQ
ncbi:MAG: 2TM domain-containing protein [Dehalococcoidia bacterium]|nr:2TM domain-containing protein [Dehalococcoidia bacterium]